MRSEKRWRNDRRSRVLWDQSRSRDATEVGSTPQAARTKAAGGCLLSCRARRPIRQRAWGVEIGPGIDTHAETIDQLAAQPTRHQRREEADHLEHQRQTGWCALGITAQPPGDGEEDDDDDIAQAVRGGDPFGARPGRSAAQSMAPKIAASRPVMIPAAIIGRDA
jgi:hypothetical protein